MMKEKIIDFKGNTISCPDRCVANDGWSWPPGKTIWSRIA